MIKSTKAIAIVACLAPLMSATTLPAMAADTPGNHAGHDMSMMNAAGAIGDIPVNAMINKVDAEKRTVNVTHDPIPALKWPTMTMDLPVTKRVDLAMVKPGVAVIMTLKLGRDKQYRITDIKLQK